MSKQLFRSEQRLSDAWQCQSCACYFPHIPNLLNNDVKRCSKCVEVEILEARLSKMEEALKYYLDTAIYDPELVGLDGKPIPVERWTERAVEALAGESASDRS